MKRIETGDSERMAYEEPLGVSAWYCGALALIGVGLPLFAFARNGPGVFGDSGDSGGDSWIEKAMLIALGGAWLLFTVRAGRGAFRRLAFAIDRRAKTVRTRSWWPFPPGHAKPLASYGLVAVGEIAIPGPLASSIPTRQTTVSLVDAATGKPLRIATGDDSPMRTLAEDVARFAGFDMIDTTVAMPKVIPAAEVGRPLRAVEGGKGEHRNLRPLPASSTLAVSNPEGGLRIEYPTGHAGCFRLLVVAVLVILVVIVATAFRMESLTRWLIYPIGGVIALIVLLIAGAGSMPVRTVLEASVDGLQIIRHRPFGTRRISLSPDSLRGFEVGPLALTIRWENGQWNALGLSTDERAWIADALSEALSAPVTLDAEAMG